MSLVLVDEEFLRRRAEEENRETEGQQRQISGDEDDSGSKRNQENSDLASNHGDRAGGGEGTSSSQLNGSSGSLSPDLLKQIMEEFHHLKARVTVLEKEKCEMKMEILNLKERTKVLETKTLPQETFCCPVAGCKKKTQFKWKLLSHKRIQHPELNDQLRRYKCGGCFKRLRSRTVLLGHRNIHKRSNLRQKQASNNGGDGVEAETGSIAPGLEGLLNMHEPNQAKNKNMQTLREEETRTDFGNDVEKEMNGNNSDADSSYLPSEPYRSPFRRQSSRLTGQNIQTSILTTKESKPERGKHQTQMHGSQLQLPSTSNSNSSLAVIAEKRNELKKSKAFENSKKTHQTYRHYKCQFCDKSFTQQANCSRHENSIHWQEKGLAQENGHKCEICGKVFFDKCGLAYHVRIHSDKTLKCLICSKSFNLNFSLNRHMLTHNNGPKRFKCRVCEKTFIQKPNCSHHEKRHHSEELGLIREKKYECEICRNMFYTAQELKQHTLTHSDARPNKCSTCSRSYKRNSDLLRHIRTVHGSRK